MDTSIIFITHDLGVVANVADRVAVMYAGKIVETGTVDEIFYNPKHPYTWGLLAQCQIWINDEQAELHAIPGSPPDLINPPKGDAFAPRNQYALRLILRKNHQCLKYLIHILQEHGYFIQMHRKLSRLKL